MSSEIPSFYRVWFTIIDPLITLAGIYGTYINPSFLLDAYSPAPVSPMAIETSILLDAIGGFFASLAFLQFFLLRASNDVTVWRIFQASTVFVDFGVVFGFLRSMYAQGRIDLASWRGDEHSQIWGQLVLGLFRLAFALGVGLNDTPKHKGKGKGKEA